MKYQIMDGHFRIDGLGVEMLIHLHHLSICVETLCCVQNTVKINVIEVSGLKHIYISDT